MSQSQKEAVEYAEVLLAYSRGETIQMRRSLGCVDDEWGSLAYPLWDFARFEYRVAPKPVERWVRVGDDLEFTSAHPKKSEIDVIVKSCGGRAVLMREVTE